MSLETPQGESAALSMDFEYVNREGIIKYLVCSICLSPFRSPVEAPCGQGHVFCQECYSRRLESGGACPDCGNAFAQEAAKPAMLVSRMVDDLDVFCSNRVNGCCWIGKRRTLEQHIQFDCISLNVGGRIFYTNRAVLCTCATQSSLAKYFADNFDASLLPLEERPARDADGRLFFDRDPAMFEILLRWLTSVRDGVPFVLSSVLEDNALYVERKYWDIGEEPVSEIVSPIPFFGQYRDLNAPYIQRLICEVCKAPFFDPVTTSCLHTFCRKCLQEGDPTTCRTCGTSSITFTSAAATLVDLVDDLVVSCAQSAKGCIWYGPRRSYRQHYLAECVYGCKTGEITQINVAGVTFTTFAHTLGRFKGEAHLFQSAKVDAHPLIQASRLTSILKSRRTHVDFELCCVCCERGM